DRLIGRFCEDVLIKSGRTEETYHRYGLTTVTGPTYLSIYRETVKRYPGRDRRQVLLDLIEARGQRGKWFAAAKDAGFLDIALLWARDFSVEPATLVRAARDFAAKEPKVAAEIGLLALHRLLDGSGQGESPHDGLGSCLHWRRATPRDHDRIVTTGPAVS